VFLLSTTHGAEMGSLGAFVANVNFMQEHDVIQHLWTYGSNLISLINRKAVEHGIDSHFKAGGIACSPHYSTLDLQGNPSLELRTLFSQEMIRNGVVIPWIALSYSHNEVEFNLTADALDASFAVFSKALENGVENYLKGPAIKPVFRKYN
jgi:glutamate-1-semialdehyde 2,1-aminomutase